MKLRLPACLFPFCLGAMICLSGEAVFGQVGAAAGERTSTVLGPDDSINILALNCEEISKEWRIGQTGDVSFPMIGRTRLAGLTVEQAEREITKRLQKYLKEPQVTIYSSELRSRPVTVAGAVEKPGRYQIRDGMSTLFDALVQAGGPKNAGSMVTVKRGIEAGRIQGAEVKSDKDGSYSMAEFALKDIADGPNGPGQRADFKLKPFDVITVAAASGPRYVHIVGEVNHAGSVELVSQDTVSLMKLIAVAGGLTHTSAPGNTLIMHVSPEGVQTSTALVNVKKIMDGKSKDLDLIAGDIVMVPSSKAKVFSQMFTGTALNAGLTTAIYTLAKF